MSVKIAAAIESIEDKFSHVENLIVDPEKIIETQELLYEVYEIFCEISDSQNDAAIALYDLYEYLDTYHQDNYDEDEGADSLSFLVDEIQKIRKILVGTLENEEECQSVDTNTDIDTTDTDSDTDNSEDLYRYDEEEECEEIGYEADTDTNHQVDFNEKLEETKEEPEEVLTIQGYVELIKQHQERLKDIHLILCPASPFKSYLEDELFDRLGNSVNLQSSETYIRSDKHPLSYFWKKLNQDQPIYPDKKLEMGKRAHMGAYANPFHMIEKNNSLQPQQSMLITTPGDARLYNTILDYKNNICAYIQEEYNKTVKKKELMTVGFYNEYPCVMVYFDKGTIASTLQLNEGDISASAFEELVNFIASYFIGLVNYKAFSQNLPIELVRRASFGFSIPTIAPTDSSFRLSIGLVPKIYADILINSLVLLNQTLYTIFIEKKDIPSLPEQIFYGSAAHEEYLAKKGAKYNVKKLSNFLDIFFVKADAKGRTCIQNIMCTAYARNGIAAKAFKSLRQGKKAKNAFFLSLDWALQKLYIDKKHLSFQQDSEISYKVKFSDNPCCVQEEDFWDLIYLLIKRVETLKNDTLQPILKTLINSYKERNITHLYRYLEVLNELIYIVALDESKSCPIEKYGDFFGSDSEGEGEIDGQKFHKKKLIVHNGMRAIWSALIAVSKCFAQEGKYCVVYSDKKAYYEVPKGLQDIINLEKLGNPIGTQNQAHIIIADLNPCITDGIAQTITILENKNKIFIFDITSATETRIQSYLQQLRGQSPIIIFVCSGTKHQQIGADRNPYGAIYIFTKDKNTTDLLYKAVKEREVPIRSKVSHDIRHLMERIGAVPKSKRFFPKKKPVEKLEEDLIESSDTKKFLV